MTATQTDIDVAPADTDAADCAHFVDQRDPANDIATAVIEGREVVALCGYRWVPYRDPVGRPVCGPCIVEFGKVHR